MVNSRELLGSLEITAWSSGLCQPGPLGGWKEVKMIRTKCRKCLKGARISITGLDKNTLRMDMGGAVLYLTPKEDGKMEVALNSENLIDGDYAFATWTGNKWLVD
jgi:hypothetical protein